MRDYIPSDEMYKFIDCRYTGVVVAARRARQLLAEDPIQTKGKPLLRAFDDLMSGKLRYYFAEASPHDSLEDYEPDDTEQEEYEHPEVEAKGKPRSKES